MSNVTFSAGLTAILAAPGITNRLQACAAFKNALGDTRRVLVIHNGVTVRDCTLSGLMKSSAGSITGFGITSDDTASLDADLSTGSAIMRVTGGGHTVEGSLGLLGSGATFIAKASLTPNNGLALVDIAIPLRQDLPLGLSGGLGVPVEVEMIPYPDGLNPGQPTSIYFDENAGDIIRDDAQRFAETGPIPYWRSTETFVLGTGGYAMEAGFHRATLPANCNDEANVPVHEVFGFWKPYARAAAYPAMSTWDMTTDSTFPRTCKFKVYDEFRNLLFTIENHDGTPINSPTQSQVRNANNAWRPFMHCKQMIYGSTHRLKLSANARKWSNGMVPGTSNRPGQCRQKASANRAFPALGTRYQQINGYGHWKYMPPYPLSTSEQYTRTDPHGIYGMNSDPTGNASDGGRYPESAIGFMAGPGYIAGHDPMGPPGGNAHDRFYMPSPLAAYLTEPNGTRPQGNVPYKLLSYEYMKGYFNSAHHDITNVRTAATLPHLEVAYGGWAYCKGRYTQQGPIFVPGGAGRHIDWFNGEDSGVPPRDRDGLLPYHGAEIDAPHSYKHPAWFALMYNSVAAEFSAMMYYNAVMMSSGASGSPTTDYGGFLMQRQHAWRWHNQAMMWKIGCTHPALLSRAQVTTRFLQELEFAHDTVRVPATTPANANYNNFYYAALRNFGIPGRDYVNGTQHCLAHVDDGKLLYLGGVLATAEATGFASWLRANSVKGGAMWDSVTEWVHTYAVKQFNASHGRQLVWLNQQSSPYVPVGQPLVPYTGYTEWAANHAPVNGQQDLVRNPDGTPFYVERQQYQHLMVQTIFMFRDFLGGEAKWPGTNAACAVAQEQENYKANLIATNYYNGLYGDYEYRWDAAGIAAAPQV